MHGLRQPARPGAAACPASCCRPAPPPVLGSASAAAAAMGCVLRNHRSISRLVAGLHGHNALRPAHLRLLSTGRAAGPAGPQGHLVRHKPLLPGRFCAVQREPQPSARSTRLCIPRTASARRGHGAGALASNGQEPPPQTSAGGCLNRINRRLWLVGTSCLGLFLLSDTCPAVSVPLPPAQRGVVCGAACTSCASCLLRRRLLFGRLHLIVRGQDITRRTKTTRKAVQVGQAEAHVPQSNRAPEGHEVPVRARLHNGTHSALQRDLGRRPGCPALCWRWPAGRSAGRPRCAPSSSRTQKPAARRRQSSGPACGPR